MRDRPGLRCRQDVLREDEVVEVEGLRKGWRWARLAVEYQGDHHRTDPYQWRRDQQRMADLAAAGWLVIPATSLVFRRPDVLAEQVLEALATRAS